MVRREMNWRLAMYVSALVGGALWGVLGGLALNDSFGDATEFTAHSWWWPVLASVAMLAAGAIMVLAAHTITLRSIGVALMLGAASGWYVVACSAVWGW